MSWFSASLSLMMLSCCWNFAFAEWVEIPQFSDQHKVYRLPIKVPPSINRRVHESDASNKRYQTYDGIRKFGVQTETSFRNISAFLDNWHHQSFTTGETHGGTIATFTTERVVTSIVEASNNDNGSETDLDDSVEIESPQEQHEPQLEKVPLIYSSSEDTTTMNNPVETTTLSATPNVMKKSKYSNQTNDDKGFLDYLPVDLLKRVHKKLKSQPPTLRGKILFLKEFERTLLHEIESRLSAALAPKRVPRGARGHDYHDEHGIGFPSLEGTLMAISFLTFAVYLVRLVMMLFRNATNNGASPIFIGRRKRSVDDANNEKAKILAFLDEARLNHY